MLRLTLTVALLLAICSAGRNRQTTDTPMTTRRVRGGGKAGKGGGVTTTEAPRGGKGGKGGATTTTEAPRGGKGGKGGRQTTTTYEPTRRERRGGRGGGNGGGAECANALPQGQAYVTLLDALFSNNGELVEVGAQALENYENANGPQDYNNNVRTLVRDILDTLLDEGYPESLRVLLTLQDGTVVYDSSQGNRNTYANSNADNNEDRINENHNSRVAILVAQLSACGIGYEEKLSTSTGGFEYYVAVRVFDQYASFGTVRVSYQTDGTTTAAPGGKGGKGNRS